MIPEEELVIYNKRTEKTFIVESAKYCRRIQDWVVIIEGDFDYQVIFGDILMFIDTPFRVKSLVSNNGELVINMERVQ